MSDDLVSRLKSPEVFISIGGMTSLVAHEAADHIEAQAAEIARLRAELATANTWRDTINSRLTSWMHPVLDGEEPHDALMRLLDFERRAFCDPALSQDAADLVATARREGMEEAAKIAERVGRLYGAGVAETVSDVIRAAAKEEHQ